METKPIVNPVRESLNKGAVSALFHVVELSLIQPDKFLISMNENGNCKNKDPGIFDSRKDNTKENRQLNDAAKLICNTCVIRSSCLNYAIEKKEVGIWGGLTESERVSLRRENARKRLKQLGPKY